MKTTAVGIIWPGTPLQGDIDEANRYVADGVDVLVVEPDGAPDPNADITLEKALLLPGDRSIERAARDKLPEVAAIAYACTSASYVRGVGGDKDISYRISSATALPATTTSSAAVSALHHLGVKRVAVLSPHVDLLNQRLAKFLEGNGIEVVRMEGLGMEAGIELLPPEEIRRIVTEDVDGRDADGIFVSCTSMRTAGILDQIERTTGKPLVSAIQATMWEVQKLGGVFRPVAGLGRLFRGTAPWG